MSIQFTFLPREYVELIHKHGGPVQSPAMALHILQPGNANPEPTGLCYVQTSSNSGFPVFSAVHVPSGCLLPKEIVHSFPTTHMVEGFLMALLGEAEYHDDYFLTSANLDVEQIDMNWDQSWDNMLQTYGAKKIEERMRKAVDLSCDIVGGEHVEWTLRHVLSCFQNNTGVDDEYKTRMVFALDYIAFQRMQEK